MADFLGIPRVQGVFLAPDSQANDTNGFYNTYTSIKSFDYTSEDQSQGKNEHISYIGLRHNLVNKDGSITPEGMETLNHELGHHIEATSLRLASDETIVALEKSFIKHVKSIEGAPELKKHVERFEAYAALNPKWKNRSPFAFFSLMGGPVSIDHAINGLEEPSGSIGKAYARSFAEWHAQGWARELTKLTTQENTQPNSILERYFGGLARTFQKMFDAIKDHPLNNLADDTFANYVRGVVETAGDRPLTPPVRSWLERGGFDTTDAATDFDSDNTTIDRDFKFNASVDAKDKVDFVNVGLQAREADAAGVTKNSFYLGSSRGAHQVASPRTSLLSTDTVSGKQSMDVGKEVERIVKKGKLKMRPQVIRAEDIPADVWADAQYQSGLLEPIIKGYSTPEGQAVIVENNIENARDLEQVLLEELMHSGLGTVLGGSYNGEMNRMINGLGGVKGIIDFATKYSRDFRDRYAGLITHVQSNPKDIKARNQLMEEAMAETLGHRSVPRNIQLGFSRIAGALRKVLERTFPDSFNSDYVSDYEVFKLARRATRAEGRSTVQDTSAFNKFFLASSGTNLYVRDASGNLVGVGKEGTQRIETRTEIAKGVSKTLADRTTKWLSDHAEGNTGSLRKAIRESEWWQNAQVKLAQVHASIIQLDRDFQNNLKAGFANRFHDTLRSETDYLADKNLLQGILDGATDDSSRFMLYQPGALVSTFQDKARDMNAYRRLAGGDTMLEREQEVQKAIMALKTLLKVNDKRAIEAANTYLVAQHARARNDRMWYMKGAIMSSGTSEQRDALVQALDSPTAGPDAWQDLVDWVDTHQSTIEGNDRDGYSASGLTDAEAQVILDGIAANPAHQRAYENIRDATFQVRDGTNEINKAAGRWTTSLQNRINAFNWQDTYLTLMGDAENENSGMNGMYNSSLDEQFRAVEGRGTLPDALGSTLAKARKSFEYLAAQEVSAAVAVNVATNRFSDEHTDADSRNLTRGNVEQFNPNEAKFKNKMKSPGKNRLVYFNPDNATLPADQQSALVIELATDNGVNAIKGSRSKLADDLETKLRKIGMPQGTSIISSLKTFRNIAFLPFELIRTSLTFSYNIGQDEDFEAISEFGGQLMSPGYMGTIIEMSELLAEKDVAGIEAMVRREGKDSLAGQLQEFVALGGRSNFLDSLKLEPLNEINGVKLPNAQAQGLNDFFEKWNNVTDLVGRFAYYQVKVQRGLPKQAAAAQALNLANFSARGEYSGFLGSFYGFFKATASGAFGQANQALNGNNTGPMMTAGFAVGAMLYMGALLMSGENEEEENIVAEMNGKRFVRDFSFNVGGQDFRVGLGFGPIAVAISAGMQMARAGAGHQSMTQTADNILSSMKDNASVIPTSGIGALESPLEFIFDSTVPTVFKPVVQVFTNTNGLGIEVFSGGWDETYSARTGTRGGLEEWLAIGMQENTPWSINPDVLKHIANQYGGALWAAPTALFEVAEELRDGEQDFDMRRGTYFLNQFFGPERFTQTGTDFYEVYNTIREQRELIKDSNKAARFEYAEELEADPIYQQLIGDVDAAEDQLTAINKKYRDDIWQTDLPINVRERAYFDAYDERYELMLDFNARIRGYYQ